MSNLSPEQFSEWLLNTKYPNGMTRADIRTAKEAVYGEWPTRLNKKLKEALAKGGAYRPYKHQEDAIVRVLAGENVVISTPTSSGKTFCYNVPVLQSLFDNPRSRALYMFPTKALAHDQQVQLQELVDNCLIWTSIHAVDGDTSFDDLRDAQEHANIILTNPDKLSHSVLPRHKLWKDFFSNLKYVVIDEMHMCRGVFGSHVANVIRRLKRICRHYKTRPQYILLSASIANPEDLATKLIGETVSVVSETGAPSGEKHLLFYNPPVVDEDSGKRVSSFVASQGVIKELLRNQTPSIVFTQSRASVERLVPLLRDEAPFLGVAPLDIQGYRSGYLPEERREIERGLRDGEVLCVVATNALELGINIGSLDACVLVGYPGTITATWQRFGRVGRKHNASILILVASDSPPYPTLS